MEEFVCNDTKYEKLKKTAGMERMLEHVPMSRYTSFRIGGPARLFFEAETEEELVAAVNAAKATCVPFHIIGNGTNLLVSDNGIDGLVFRICEKLSRINGSDGVFEVSAGTLLSVFAKRTVEAGYTGLEWAAGIPGTVGGAVAMNAGAYGGEIRNSLRSVRCLESDGTIAELEVADGDMGYRKSAFAAPERIVLSARFVLERGDGGEAERMAEYSKRRREKQPLSYPSAGSVFKRPEGHFAGALIEEAGLKGIRIGGAEVSRLHAGFIINTGGACAADVKALVRLIQDTVYEKSGVMLQLEIKQLS